MKILSKSFFILCFSLLLLNNLSLAQSFETLWAKTYGGTNIDVAHSFQQTSDGGYIITGYTRSFGTMSGRNIWLVKTDSIGNQSWVKAFGGDADEEAYSVQQTSDKGYVFAGYTESMGMGQNDFIIYKTDSLGNEQWNRTFGGTLDEEAFSVLQLSDGGFIIAGVTSSFARGGRDAWVIRTDGNGVEKWSYTYGGLSSDGTRNIQKTSDGGFILTGWNSTGDAIGNAMLLKIDSLGNEQWLKTFGGTSADRGYCVQQTSDGGYIMTGYTASTGNGNDDMWLVKTNSLGDLQWSKTYGGTYRDYGNWIEITPDGGYLVTGYTNSFGAGGDDVYFVKTDSTGVLAFAKTFGGTASDVGYCGRQVSDGNYVITGHTLSYGAGVHDGWFFKTAYILPVELTSFNANAVNNNVKLTWTTATEINNKGFDVQRELGDSWLTIGFVEGKGTSTTEQQYSFTDFNNAKGVNRYRIMQIDFNGEYEYSNEVEIFVGTPLEFNLSQNYPNPFNPITSIKYSISNEGQVEIKVFDLLGREVAQLVNEIQPAGNYEMNFDASKLSSGTYFYKLNSGNFYSTKKLILIK